MVIGLSTDYCEFIFRAPSAAHPPFEGMHLLKDDTRNQLGDNCHTSPAGVSGARHSLLSKCPHTTSRACGGAGLIARTFFISIGFLSQGLLMPGTEENYS